MNSTTLSAMENLLAEPQLSSIWNITKFKELQQGTSRNENFHHYINARVPSFVTGSSYHYVSAMIAICCFAWNNRCVLLITNLYVVLCFLVPHTPLLP